MKFSAATWKTNSSYFDALKLLASFSGLFSDNEIPYLDYRLAENAFCRFFEAENEARSCTAYDACTNAIGIGIKTFTLKNNQSTEKIAEFNKLKDKLDSLSGIDLAKQLGIFRNDRITLADSLYSTTNRLYHIVGRTEGCLRIFNTSYDCVDIDNIKMIKDNNHVFNFHDGHNEYFFNRSKSVLIKRFAVPEKDCFDVPIEIIKDPLSVLMRLFRLPQTKDILMNTSGNINLDSLTAVTSISRYKKGIDYVILPLYSERDGIPYVPEKSGLNQWNANGRKRDPNEIYIPIPIAIHHKYPTFFPPRNEHFSLELPDKKYLSAKICQDNSKALMSTHNADLGHWLLRKVLKKKEGQLVTIDDLNRFGIDSVRIVNRHRTDKDGKKVYSISFNTEDYESYSDFLDS